ncbi:glycerophosphodiester phosphodiesterase family protein [Stenotrophomonas mori]|uniref:Glycerophosphodiester phosphodiesterase family protein n=1 Tax=Stenotrophomonas mori TaxID=2871096 RepID=A0ABT0SJG1_9GAMM|nr:glycerophosphodiester phosphodiesterase family protein [Stenotrophomonas mori]MCL7715467.1 glycerophosphodiester phosphodiesterase family protein [Stenotrophomonas mori]
MKATSILLCAALAAGLLPPGPAAAQQTPVLRDPSRVLVIAHRGCVGEAPEVSVASIHACVGKDIDGIELDIRKTRDGVLVSIHDDTVDRTTDGSGRVDGMTLEEIRRLRLRRGNGGAYAVVTDEPVPTLEDMLRAAREAGFIVHLDIKDATHAEVAAVVQRLGMAGRASAWISGAPAAAHQPDPRVGEVLAIIPRIQECPPSEHPACRSGALDDLEGFAAYRPAGYFLWYRSTPAFFQRFNAAARVPETRVATETLWEIDNLPTPQRHARYRELRALGATLFLTDKPADMARVLRGQGGEG